MKVLIPVFDNIPPIDGVPALDRSKLTPVYPQSPIESGALEHWLLGGTSDSLIGMRGVSALSPMGATPTYQPGYASLPRGAINGLASDIIEPNQFSMCMVFRYTANSDLQRALFDTAQAGSGDGNGFLISQNLTNSMHALIRPNTSSTFSARVDAALGGWFFICLAVDAATNQWTPWRPGHTATNTLAQAYQKSTRGLAFGNAYYAASTHYEGLDMAEAIIFDKVLSANEISDVYERSKNRLADRGIDIY